MSPTLIHSFSPNKFTVLSNYSTYNKLPFNPNTPKLYAEISVLVPETLRRRRHLLSFNTLEKLLSKFVHLLPIYQLVIPSCISRITHKQSCNSHTELCPDIISGILQCPSKPTHGLRIPICFREQ
jgi:hypothetical protein